MSRQRLPMQHPNVDRMAEFFAADPNFYFGNIPTGRGLEDRLRMRIEQYLPGDIREWYNRLPNDQKIAFIRGVLLGVQRRAGQRAGGTLAHIWDAFVRPETLSPPHDRVQGVIGQRTSAPKGTPQNPGQRPVGFLEGFGNFFTTPLRALTTTMLTATAQGRTFGRESGTPTTVTNWASVYAMDPSWGSLLEAWLPNTSPLVRQIVGGSLNLLLDPLNLLGLGPMRTAARAARTTARKAVNAVPPARSVAQGIEKAKRKVNDAVETSLQKGKKDPAQIQIREPATESKPLTLQDMGTRLAEGRTNQLAPGPENLPRGLNEAFPPPSAPNLPYDEWFRNIRMKIDRGASHREIVDALVQAIKQEREALQKFLGENARFEPFNEDRVRNLLYKAIRSNDPAERTALVDQALREGITFTREEWKERDPALMFSTRQFTLDAINALPETIALRKTENPNPWEQAVRGWKATKTSLNFPAGVVRNFGQNFIYRWLTGDVSEGEIAKGIARAIMNPRRVQQLVRELRGRIASDPQLASQEYFERVARESGDQATEPPKKNAATKIYDWLRERFGDADLAAAAIMALGKSRKATAADAAKLVPDYSRVPTALQDLARLGVLPFGHWGYYALTGVGRGLLRDPQRAAKLIDAFNAGRADERDWQYTDIPGTNREIRTDVVAPFELGAGTELPLWALEQNPLISLGLRLHRGKREGAIPREMIGFITPPVLSYYAPNLAAELLNLPRHQRQRLRQYLPIQQGNEQRQRETLDFLLGLFGFPTRPQNRLADAENALRKAEQKLRNQ